MVAPVTGPFETGPLYHYADPWVGPWGVVSYGHIDTQRYRSSKRQVRPYNLPLPYYYYHSRITGYSDVPQYQSVNSTGVYWGKTQFSDAEFEGYAMDVARKRFNTAVGEAASWLVTLAQSRQAMDMLTGRLLQMVRFTKALKRLDFSGAAQQLLAKHDQDGWTQYRKTKGRLVKRSDKRLADHFLEYHWGWKPIVQDIYTSIDILQREIEPQRICVQGTFRGQRSGSGNAIVGTRVSTSVCRIGADVTVSNPNLYLANQLGLVNPASALFDLIKWSYLLDWFVNVSEFLNSFTEYAGLSLTNQFYTRGYRESLSFVWPEQSPGGFTTKGSGESFKVERILGAPPSVSLKIRKPWRLSAARAAAASSVLVQMMPDDNSSRSKSLKIR